MTTPTTARPTDFETLKTEAEAHHVQFPQYKGHWDGWKLVRVTRVVRTKAGIAFMPGDVVLARQVTEEDPAGTQHGVEAYSFRTRNNTVLPSNRYSNGRRAFEWLS